MNRSFRVVRHGCTLGLYEQEVYLRANNPPDMASTLNTWILVIMASVPTGALVAQNTIGVVEYSEDAVDGYMLIYPDQQGTVYLLDGCGRVVNRWEDFSSVPGNGSRLFSEGKLMRTYVDADGGNPFFTQGGNGEHIQIKDWDNGVLWDYTLSSELECLHHDAEVLPNGNVLVIAWELKTMEEAWLAGRDTVGFGYSTLWPDKLVELRPTGLNTADVVWEWHAWDHLVQDFDPLAANYGVVADHPELIDINFVYQANTNPDWLHINSVDYDPELDQVLLSVPFFNEVWIIDHSTTTEEAAMHTGGQQGKGGDLLYRWGNPRAYGRGTEADQQLFFNHGALWVGPGLPVDDPDRGHIIVFNNRVQPGVSAADIFVPPVDASGAYELLEGAAYGPLSRSKRYAAEVPTDLSSPGQGSAQKLPNDIVLATSGRQGWALQLRPDSSVAWSYVVPMQDGQPVAQGTEIVDRTIIFQAEWILPDDERLTGLNLVPEDYLELEPNTTFCNLTTSVQVEETWGTLGVQVVSDLLPLPKGDAPGTYAIFDPMGRVVLQGHFTSAGRSVPVSALAPGSYFLHSDTSVPLQRFVVAR